MIYCDDIREYPPECIADKQALKVGRKWSHLWCDRGDEEALHALARKVGMKREWFQNRHDFPHYDLVPARRRLALMLGATPMRLKEWLKVDTRPQPGKGLAMKRNDYETFLASKAIVAESKGIQPKEPHSILFQFQRDCVKWALRRGRACLFEDCGLGKTIQSIEWARQIPGDVLIVAPLNVAQQTIAEGKKVDCEIRYCRKTEQFEPGISITNYEMLEKLDVSRFAGVVLDESSILKNFTGTTRNLILQQFAETPYRLACTATPAPNDFMELGNHAEFVGAMTRTEMLSMFFVHDGGDTSQWRLKGHAEDEFWKWVCSWAVMIRKPSNLGYEDDGFKLPPLNMHEHIIQASAPMDGYLLPMPASTLSERRSARKVSIGERVAMAADLAKSNDEQWVFWCNLNSESEALTKAIGAEEITGSTSMEERQRICDEFLSGKIRCVVSKGSLWGFGLNLQTCANTAFVGISDSYEEFYQMIRRFWRFGQKKEVHAHIIISDMEGAVLKNIKRKEADAERMANEMVKHMHSINEANLKGTTRKIDTYAEDIATGKTWTVYLGDCVDVAHKLDAESIDFAIFSPPFDSLYTYSASDRDMGNCLDSEDFAKHFQFLVKELFRVMRSGRLVSFHCMNLPTSKTKHGYIGIRDFRGELIRAFEAEGFIFHSEVCIWKDPVTAMQRTKALGLLHKQMVKDSCMSRQGIPDYLVTVRKPGENQNRVEGELDRWIGDDAFKSEGRLSIDLWQRYASPVWMDINPSRTLQKESAREEKDERHICPLQLDVIERAMELWSNPGDLVFSPFAGIGSEGYVAVNNGRRFVGIELKTSYWKQAVANLKAAETQKADDLFAPPEAVGTTGE